MLGRGWRPAFFKARSVTFAVRSRKQNTGFLFCEYNDSVPMPCFQIHRLREDRRQQFRLTPHTSGVTSARPKDYEKDTATIEAASAYAAWSTLRGGEKPLMVGDILEDENGALRICKYTGFEEARWAVPEAPAAVISESAESAGPALQ